jgi:exopolysaccharide production protein ExoZ
VSKIENIQALRGIAVLLVVCIHALHIEQKYGGHHALLPDVLQFGMSGVDLFFVISGFVMVTVTRGKFQNLRQALRFAYHRLARIYPTYWFYSLLLLGVWFIRPTWINAAGGNQVDFLASFLLLPSHILPMVVVGWTLIHELYFYLVFSVLLLLVRERRLAHAVLLWAGAIWLVQAYSHSSSAAIAVASHPLTLEFIGGCLIASLYFKSRATHRTGTYLAMASVGTVASFCAFLSYQHITGSIVLPDWWRVAIFGIPALLVVYGLANAERNGYVLPDALIRVGDASYSIYLSHVLTLSAAGRVWSLFSLDSVIDNLVMVPALFALVLLVGFLSYRWVEKPLLGVTRKIA